MSGGFYESFQQSIKEVGSRQPDGAAPETHVVLLPAHYAESVPVFDSIFTQYLVFRQRTVAYCMAEITTTVSFL